MSKKHKVLVIGLIKVVKYAALGIFAAYSGSGSGAVTSSSVSLEAFGLDSTISCTSLDWVSPQKQKFTPSCPRAESLRHP